YAVYGITSNAGKAENWYKKAAKAGDAEAQYLLSELLSKKDYTLASGEWLRKSADQGYGPAEFKIGLEYDQRDQDYEQAKYWYKRSVEHGCEKAKYRLYQLEQEGK
ncbi:MAG: hypothetical protein K2L89_02030, partial [Muribaculaceae bacterium]|nr:hypothetical protein [Muribaculaceae bacterium]